MGGEDQLWTKKDWAQAQSSLTSLKRLITGTIAPTSALYPENPEQKAIEAFTDDLVEMILEAMRIQRSWLEDRGLTEPPD